jgi:hypothetical protein
MDVYIDPYRELPTYGLFSIKQRDRCCSAVTFKIQWRPNFRSIVFFKSYQAASSRYIQHAELHTMHRETEIFYQTG